jgi:hypothetical protein
VRALTSCMLIGRVAEEVRRMAAGETERKG